MIKMPEPAAWMAEPVMQSGHSPASVFCSDQRMAFQWDHGGHPEYGRMIVQPLITTTQAEAYAQAVRREALEEAAQAILDESEGAFSVAGLAARRNAATTIRALIDKEPK